MCRQAATVPRTQHEHQEACRRPPCLAAPPHESTVAAVLRATGIPEKYGVRGYPTLVVLDRRGVVRAFHVGYSPTLRQHLIETINGLLAEDS